MCEGRGGDDDPVEAAEGGALLVQELPTRALAGRPRLHRGDLGAVSRLHRGRRRQPQDPIRERGHSGAPHKALEVRGFRCRLPPGGGALAQGTCGGIHTPGRPLPLDDVPGRPERLHQVGHLCARPQVEKRRPVVQAQAGQLPRPARRGAPAGASAHFEEGHGDRMPCRLQQLPRAGGACDPGPHDRDPHRSRAAGRAARGRWKGP
mmetsp:Transcript_106369/g.317935  ORF Transcript_106369/g.317935 Transcript_106369/m.317935 type:complete len:206 (-) Transcript_106369:69-686(-)